MRQRSLPGGRLPLLALGMVSLLLGLWAALALLGLPVDGSPVAADHGPLMVYGFLGTVIAMERAVAIDEPWGYAAPALAGVGSLALVAGAPAPAAKLLVAAAGIVLLLLYLAAYRIQPALHLVVQAGGAAAWYGGVLLWLLQRPMHDLVPWFAAFLVLTIVGERLELSRVAALTPRTRLGFLAAGGVFGLGLLGSLVDQATGVRVAGLGLVALAAWLARHDVARRTIRIRGVTRFMAACLIAGYGWIAVAGVLWLVHGLPAGGPTYDASLHAVFLGFVMSMIFGHAPVIVPAVLRVRLPYHGYFYAHLILLHASLLLRLLGGDLAGSTTAWQVGGVLNVVAVLVFLGASVLAVVTAPRRGAPAARGPAGLRGESGTKVGKSSTVT